MWATSYLKEEVFAKFKPYIAYYLEKGSVANCDLIIVKVVNTIGYYIHFFL